MNPHDLNVPGWVVIPDALREDAHYFMYPIRGLEDDDGNQDPTLLICLCGFYRRYISRENELPQNPPDGARRCRICQDRIANIKAGREVSRL